MTTPTVKQSPVKQDPAKQGPVKRIIRILSILLLVLLTSAIIGSAIFHEQVFRLYHVLTLFEPDKIVHNFQHMDTIFMTRTIKAPATPSPWGQDKKPLPTSFVYNGETINSDQFLEDTWTTGFMVIKDDRVLFEEYYRGLTKSSRAISWSMGKSMVSALVGIAVQEGHIKNLSTPVSDYVPLLRGSGYEGVSLKNVLQMSSGVQFNEDYGDFNSDINRMGRTFALGTPMDDFVISLKSEREPGTYNHYVSMDTQVLGMVLRETTGQTLSSYLEEKIWKKTGMESDAYWLVDSTGMEMAFGGLNVVLRDYARFGQLFLNNGVYDGQQIIPKQWVQDSVTPDAPHLMPGENPLSSWVMGYGYQWWIPEASVKKIKTDYMAIGVYNQYIYIHPPSRTVVVKLSAYPDYNTDGSEKTLRTVELFRTIAQEM